MIGHVSWRRGGRRGWRTAVEKEARAARGSEPVGMLAHGEDAARLDDLETQLLGARHDRGRTGPRIEPDLADLLARHLLEHAEADRRGDVQADPVEPIDGQGVEAGVRLDA